MPATTLSHHGSPFPVGYHAAALALHHAFNDPVAMARLWRQHARRARGSGQRLIVWKEGAHAPPYAAARLPAAAPRFFGCTRIELGHKGPWRLELPDGVHGVVDDGWQRPVGRLDPGGRYLLVGPAQDVSAPDDAAVLRCATAGVWLILHSGNVDVQGDAGGSAGAAAALARLAWVRLVRQTTGACAEPLLLIERAEPPAAWQGFADARFFLELAQLVAHERFASLSAVVRRQLAEVGICAGQQFAPDETACRRLDAAAAQAMRERALREGAACGELGATGPAAGNPQAPWHAHAASAAPSQRWRRAFAGLAGTSHGVGA